MNRRLLSAAFILVTILSNSGGGHAADSNEVENLVAFARLYGYLRFFHPSDEAAAADWTEIAVSGVQRCVDAADRAELEQALYEVFLPLAPSLTLYELADGPPSPATTASLGGVHDPDHIVSWQHQGVYLGESSYPYSSIRTGRSRQVDIPPDREWFFITEIDATPHQGREFRLRAAVHTLVTGPGDGAGLLAYVVRSNLRTGFSEDMSGSPITAGDWQVFELNGEIDDDALDLVIGGRLSGTGAAWFDDFRLSVRDPGGSWQNLALTNSSFEDADVVFDSWTANDPYAATIDEWHPVDGLNSLRLTSREEGQTVRLFETIPEAEDVIHKELGRGLGCALPLWLADARPYDTGRPLSAKRLPLPTMDDEDVAQRVAGVIIAWNVLQHFFPYFDVVEVDWPAELENALAGALDAADDLAYLQVLESMMATLQDGHGFVYSMSGSRGGWMPILAALVEDQVIVTASSREPLQIGDIIISVDDVPATTVLEQQANRYSGSLQWRRFRALERFAEGRAGSFARVVIDRDGAELEHDVYLAAWDYLTEPRPAPIDVLEGGVYYVDMEAATMQAIVARIDELAAAPGVIFDLRGYPNSTHPVLQYLSDEVLRSAYWNVPEIIYPDQEGTLAWHVARWRLEPRQPRFEGEVVFLTDGRAISYAESVMGIVEHYGFAEIVGRPTAGANGNVNPIDLPRNFVVFWTGLKVLKHDGSQHHLVGIQPTVPVQRTIAAIRGGIDEDIETALDLILED